MVNETGSDFANLNINKENNSTKPNTNETIQSEICANQCSCEVCKESSPNSLPSGTDSVSNRKDDATTGSRSLNGPTVPTFGKYV